jgi:hypothetical protein
MDPRDDQRQAAHRDNLERIRARAEATGGGVTDPMAPEDMPGFAQELMRRYEEAVDAGLKQCPHFRDVQVQPALWVAALPDLFTCRRCEPALAGELARRQPDRQARCDVCGKPAAVRRISLAVGTHESSVELRGGICEECEGTSLDGFGR